MGEVIVFPNNPINELDMLFAQPKPYEDAPMVNITFSVSPQTARDILRLVEENEYISEDAYLECRKELMQFTRRLGVNDE